MFEMFLLKQQMQMHCLSAWSLMLGRTRDGHAAEHEELFSVEFSFFCHHSLGWK